MKLSHAEAMRLFKGLLAAFPSPESWTSSWGSRR
jgi:hypothetical protein